MFIFLYLTMRTVKLNSRVALRKTGEKTFFWISDLHVEPLYDPFQPADARGLCRLSLSDQCPDAIYTSKEKSFPLGRIGCDPPLALLSSLLKKMKLIDPDPEFILLTGDVVGKKDPHPTQNKSSYLNNQPLSSKKERFSGRCRSPPSPPSSLLVAFLITVLTYFSLASSFCWGSLPPLFSFPAYSFSFTAFPSTQHIHCHVLNLFRTFFEKLQRKSSPTSPRFKSSLSW